MIIDGVWIRIENTIGMPPLFLTFKIIYFIIVFIKKI